MSSYSRALPIALIAGFLALPALALAQEAPLPGVISIEGIGEVTAKPDMAFVDSGVTLTALPLAKRYRPTPATWPS